MVDPGVLQCPGAAAILPFLSEQNIRFNVQPQPQKGLITFWRETTEVIETANQQVCYNCTHLSTNKLKYPQTVYMIHLYLCLFNCSLIKCTNKVKHL